jgi:hypothetical protein
VRMFQLPTRFTRSPWFMTTWWRFLQYNWWEEKEGILLLFGEVFVESFSLDLSEWKWMDFPKISPMSLLGYVVKSGYKSILHKKQQPSLWMWKMIDVGFNSNPFTTICWANYGILHNQGKWLLQSNSFWTKDCQQAPHSPKMHLKFTCPLCNGNQVETPSHSLMDCNGDQFVWHVFQQVILTWSDI